MSYDDTIYTLADCRKRSLAHRHKASALWVLDCLHVQSVQPFNMDAWFEVKGCSGEGSVATSNRRVLSKISEDFFEEVSDELRIANVAALRWAFRRKSHPLHAIAKEVVEAVNALSDYPAADDEDLSNLEYEWAEAAVGEAFEEACRDAVYEETKDLSGIYDEDDFKLEKFRDGWIRDAMSSEWWAHTKDGVRFPQMEGDTRLENEVRRVVGMWREEFTPIDDPCPVDAGLALKEIREILREESLSPAHTLELFRKVRDCLDGAA